MKKKSELSDMDMIRKEMKSLKRRNMLAAALVRVGDIVRRAEAKGGMCTERSLFSAVRRIRKEGNRAWVTYLKMGGMWK